MTPEEQKIKIAEACPKLCFKDVDEQWRYLKGPCQTPYFDPLNDLNAMHEAVKTMPDELRHSYRVQLCKAANGINPNNVRKLSKEQQDQAYWQYCNASAAQHAEAFLRTLKLWKP